MIEEKSTAQAEADLRALRELRNSRGWEILKAVVKEDLLEAALQMAESPTMTESEMHFRRGSIASSRGFVAVVDTLITRLENDVLLASANLQAQSTSNATA